jgi:hypothetical protein
VSSARRPALSRLHFDISWDEVAKYIVASPDTVKVAAGLIERFPDRSCSGRTRSRPGSSPRTCALRDVRPALAGAHARDDEKVRLTNYARLFDKARRDVRAWERANVR